MRTEALFSVSKKLSEACKSLPSHLVLVSVPRTACHMGDSQPGFWEEKAHGAEPADSL